MRSSHVRPAQAECRNTAKAARVLAAALVGLSLSAAQAGAQAPSPGLSLGGPEPLTVGYGELFADETLPEGQGRLVVPVTNRSSTEQSVVVRVVGLRPPAGAAPDDTMARLFGRQGAAEQTVPAGATRKVSVPAQRDQAASPRPDTYEGSVIAAGEEGPVVRRPLVITVTAPLPKPVASPAAAPTGATLAAGSLKTLTVPAVNYVPSVLSPVWPTLIVIVVIVGVLAVILLPAPSAWKFDGRTVWLVTVFVGLGLVVGLAWHDEAPHQVHAEDVPVASTVEPGRVGVASAVNGSLVELRVQDDADDESDASTTPAGTTETATQAAGAAAPAVTGSTDPAPTNTSGQSEAATGSSAETKAADEPAAGEGDTPRRVMVVDNAKRAGAYTGSVDLDGAGEVEVTEVTVNVRDFWLWAALTLGLGVGIAYGVGRYFSSVRVRRGHQVDLDAVWRTIGEDDSQFQLKAFGRPHAEMQMTQRARWWYRKAQDHLKDEEFQAAEKATAALEEYAGKFSQLRQRMNELDADVRRLDAAFPPRHPSEGDAAGSDDAEAAAQAAADAARDAAEKALRAPFDGPDPDEDAKLITKRQEKVDAASDLVKEALAAAPVPEQLLAIQVGHTIARFDSAPQPPAVQPVVTPQARTPAKDTATVRSDADDIVLLNAHVEPWHGSSAKVSWDFGDGDRAEAVAVPAEGGVLTTSVRHRFRRSPSIVAFSADHVDASVEIRRHIPGRHKRQELEAKVNDRQMTLLAGLLAVGSGMVALYFADPAWGAPGDYLEAVLWGGAVTGGLTLVAGLVAKTVGAAK